MTNSFGELPVRLRKDAGLTRSQLAQGADLSYPYVSQLETGQRNPSRKATWALAGPLGVDPAVLEAAVPADESDPRSVRRAAMNLSSMMSVSPVRAMASRDEPLEVGSKVGSTTRPGSGDIIGDVLDLLDELDPDERLEALAEIQRQTMQRIIAAGVRKR